MTRRSRRKGLDWAKDARKPRRPTDTRAYKPPDFVMGEGDLFLSFNEVCAECGVSADQLISDIRNDLIKPLAGKRSHRGWQSHVFIPRSVERYKIFVKQREE